jgi:O-antigen/teichoic acid export membrane protein
MFGDAPVSKGDTSDPYARTRLRQALLHFLSGRLLSSLLGVFNLLALIRLLTPQEFGLYAALLSLQVLFLAASSFGIETTMERYLPEVRIRQGRSAVLPYIMRSLGMRLAALAATAVALLVGLPWLLPMLDLAAHESVVTQYVWVIVAVALMNSASTAHEALLHQHAAQTAAVAYAGVRTALILWGASDGGLTIEEVVVLDLVAAVTALTILLAAIGGYARDAFKPSGLPKDANLWRRFYVFASRNFAGQLLLMASGNHTMRLALTASSGLLETARFGFAMSLAEMLQRYLPATLLLRMIRPIFVSRYIENRNFAQLNAFANLVLKLNMLMLVPAIAFVAAAGAPLADALSGGRYADAKWLLLGMLLLLITVSHQTVISILAGTLEENDIQIRAGGVALLAVPLAFVLIPSFGAYGSLIAAASGAVLYNVTCAWLLRRRGFDYGIDMAGLGRLFVAGIPAACATWITLAASAAVEWQRPAVLVAASAACLLAFVLCAARFKAFTPAERQTIHGLMPRRAFPF